MTKEDIIKQLALEKHIEGGYFRRTFTSEHQGFLGADKRQQLSSIYYMLTDEQPIGHLHKNRSDILHFFLAGRPIKYTLINPLGDIQTVILGPDLNKGHRLQFLAPGGFWKASELLSDDVTAATHIPAASKQSSTSSTAAPEHDSDAADYGLIAEAVSPAFDFSDMQMATAEQIRNLCPQQFPALQRLILK